MFYVDGSFRYITQFITVDVILGVCYIVRISRQRKALGLILLQFVNLSRAVIKDFRVLDASSYASEP